MNVDGMLDKYLDLVWYSRTLPENAPYWEGVAPDVRREAFKRMIEIEITYPVEVSELHCQEHGDMTYGFNNGALAMLRFMLTLEDLGEREATERFPSLDT